MGPRTVNQLSNSLNDGYHCKFLAIRKHNYEVKDVFTKFVVNLVERTYKCNVQLISGLPCKYAVACITKRHKNIEEYCHEYYSKSMYIKTYSSIMHPLPDFELLREINVTRPT